MSKDTNGLEGSTTKTAEEKKALPKEAKKFLEDSGFIREGEYSYLEKAQENEEIFKNILRDLKKNAKKYSMGIYVPDDLDTESSVDELFKKYSEGNRYGIFTITNFTIEEKVALFSFQDIAFLSGGGATYKYEIREDKTVVFVKTVGAMMS